MRRWARERDVSFGKSKDVGQSVCCLPMLNALFAAFNCLNPFVYALAHSIATVSSALCVAHHHIYIGMLIPIESASSD